MESTGDPLLDYGEELILRAYEAGCSIPLLPLTMPFDDSAARAMILTARENLLRKGIEPPEMPLEIQKFFFGGPRPPITG